MGSGKTTFLESLYNPKKVVGSEVKFEQKDINKYSSFNYKNQIGVVPQIFNVPWGTVGNYMLKKIRYYPHIKNSSKRLDDITRNMNLVYLLKRKMRTQIKKKLLK